MSLSDQQFKNIDVIVYEYNNSDDDEREVINNFLINKGFKTYREEGVGLAFRK
jgi:hypothetical protein